MMWRTVGGLVALASVLGGVATSGQVSTLPPARDTQPPRVGTGRIRGSVVAADTGQPLRQAQVRISSPEIREQRVSTTDGEGRYEFRDLPSGPYNLNASKTSYVGLSYGQRQPNEFATPFELKDGQTAERVNFLLPRGSVIAGRILDAYGEPVADAMVFALRSSFAQGQRRLTPTGRNGTSNDIGEFRLFGLPPGQYYVSATLNAMMGGIDVSTDRTGYAPTYYPGTPDVASAQRLTLDVGQTIGDLTMVLATTRTSRVTGTAYDSQGRPITRGGVMVTPRNAEVGGGMRTTSGQIRQDGTFVVSNLPPGEYMLRASAASTVLNATQEFSVANITVVGDDISNVSLFPLRPVTLRGRIVVAQGSPQQLRAGMFRFALTPTFQTSMPMPTPGSGPQAARDDLTFEVQGYPGPTMLRSAGTQQGWAVRAIRYNDVDVTDIPIELDAGTLGEIEVEVTNQLQEVSGQVTDDKGQPLSSYSVLIFPQDRDRWATAMTRTFAIARPMQENRFTLRTLAPGDYYVVALSSLDMMMSRDPEWLDTLRTRASTFSLREGQTHTLDLKLTKP